MEKSTPHYSLDAIKAQVAARGLDAFTRTARNGAALLGLTGFKSLFTISAGPRWAAIGMSWWSSRAAWACAHASGLAAKSPDFGPTRRADTFSGGLRRCKSSP